MANADSETTIYNGLHNVKFRNGNHRYYIDGKPQSGVTTIMSKILAKPDLMLWPLNTAMKYLETQLPDITAATLLEARKAHVKLRDAGADTGTIVHGLVEEYFITAGANQTITWQPNDEVTAAYTGFLAWSANVKPTALAVEQVVYSHLYKFAGTFDSILEINGKVYLVDLKTTKASQSAPKGIYAENFIQLGAYYYAYEEQRQYELAHGGTNLVVIDDLMILSCKKNGVVDTLAASELGLSLVKCMKLWESTLFLYQGLSDIKQKLGGTYA